MRARYSVLVAAVAGIAACFPNPAKDFEDYAERADEFAPPEMGGGGFDAGPPPTEAVEGTYYGACLSQLAFYQLENVFNFYTETSFVPGEGGGTLTLTVQALKLSEEGTPPATVSSAGLVGERQGVAPSAPNVDAEGRYTVELGRTTVPGAANPITGRDVIIEDAKLTGLFGQGRFCARLNGNVTQPIKLTLEPEKNICQFVPIKDGDPTPTFTQKDFTPEACPF